MDREKLIVAYCWVSTLEQKRNGLGLEIQIRDVHAFAKSRELTVDRVYSDAAESGVAEHRKELRRLLRACEKGRVSIVIIPSLDRLSRDVRIAENLFWKFERLGIRVHIADMPFYDGSDRRDVLVRQIREAIAEENRKEIIERLWKGRQERVRQGRAAGGTTPYGFRRVMKHGLIVEPGEAVVVQTIFRLFDSGTSRTKIAHHLNGGGFRKRNGAPWTRWQVAAIVNRRKLYELGTLRYGDAQGSNAALILVKKQGCE
jgi:site-specific DNA recombinase